MPLLIRSSLLLLFPFLCSVAAVAETDQNVRAAHDAAAAAAPVKAEPILRWHGRHKRTFYDLPAENPPRLFARATFATNHVGRGVVAFSTEARGSYLPVGLTYFLDAGGVTLNSDYWKRGRKGWKPLHPGETGPWADITPALNYKYRNIFVAKAREVMGHYDTPATNSAFTVEFSRDGTNVVGAVSNGGGPVACCLLSLARGTVETDVALSAADLARARAAGTAAPKRPRRFTIRLSHAISPATMTPAAFSNEVEALRLLGPNDLGGLLNDLVDPGHESEPDFLFRSPGGSHMFNRYKGHICTPDFVGMTNQLARLLAAQAGPLARGRKLIVGTADEPFYSLASLTNCPTCRERFQKDAGRGFVLDPEQDIEGYLATVDYRDRIVCDFYKAMTDAARATHSNILCAANIGISLVFGGNADAPGTDPFFMADARALAIGQTEDWCNVQRTRQFSSYMCDVYRAAYGRNGMDFEMCSIILSAPETGAKAFAEVGHGAVALSFFNYGPHWLNGDNRNQNPAIYPVLRHFCEATAEAEEAIVGAKVAKGDAALFFSQSCDRLQIAPGWTRSWLNRSPYGKDRMCVSLMLSHCGVRTDVLAEDDLDPRLSGYRVLFATDRNIRRDAADALADWMRRGGVLVRTQGALVADDRDRPLPEGFFEKAGKVIEIDFSPWRKYVWPAKQADGCYSHRAFDEALRQKVADVVREAGVARRVFTDDPLVEASLLENGAKSAIVLSNWTTNAHPRVAVTLANPPSFDSVRSASGAPVDWRRDGDSLHAEVEIGWGDYLVLEPR